MVVIVILAVCLGVFMTLALVNSMVASTDGSDAQKARWEALKQEQRKSHGPDVP